jgi:putative ABC transport system substrate-binding protein
MDRRAFIQTLTGGLLAAPLAAAGQQTRKIWRIGWLFPISPPANLFEGPFRQGLSDLGYVEGRDFVMEYGWAEGHEDRLPALAAYLVRARVDVIVTAGTPATNAAMQATKTIPIVFMNVGAAVEKGIVASLARPGGNVTGLTFQLGALGVLKLYQLLKEAAPTVARGVYLYDPANERSPGFPARLHAEAQAVNVEFQSVALPDDPNGVAQAFAEFGRGRNGLVLENPTRLRLKADQICGLALQRKIPTVGRARTFANAGCLMSYGENEPDMARRVAGLVDKLLKGAKPADVPVEEPPTYELVINLKTAKALGLTIPPSLLARADEVIE